MESQRWAAPPSLGLVGLLGPLFDRGGGLLFHLFEAGPIYLLGLYLIGAGEIVGRILLLRRRT